MKRVLITAGPTNEYIDEVMKITNMSTGRLGVELSKNFLSEGCYVTLVCTRSVARGGLFEKYKMSEKENFNVIQIETTEDMYNALEKESANKYDLVIHASAVGDYKPEFTFKMEDMASELMEVVSTGATYEKIFATLTNPKCKVNDDTKISSYEKHLTVKLTLTTKLISNLKRWFDGAVLVGFKLLENVTKEHIIEVATNLCEKNEMDYIIANDLADLRKGNHISYLVNEGGYCNHDFHCPEDIFAKTYSFIK